MGKMLVAYASATGNTELMAEIMIDYAEQHNCNIDVKSFDEDLIDAKDLLDYDVILIGLYTWSGGDLPFEVEVFYDEIADLDLTEKVCGVFGSGDQVYSFFCGAVDLMYDQLERAGATMVPLKVKADLEPDQEAQEECRQLMQFACDKTMQVV